MKLLSIFIIFIICIIGFASWAFLQKGYIDNSSNEAKLLIFPIIVPFIAALIVLVYFISVHSQFDLRIVLEEFKKNSTSFSDVLLIILSAIGLAVGYIIYPILIKQNPLYATYYLILSTIFITGLFIIFKWKDSSIVFNRLPFWYEVVGVLISLTGIIIIKFGNELLNLIKKINI